LQFDSNVSWHGVDLVAVPFRLSNLSNRPVRISQWPGISAHVRSCRTATGRASGLIGSPVIGSLDASVFPSFLVDVPVGGALRGLVVVRVPSECQADISVDGHFISVGPYRPDDAAPYADYPDVVEVRASGSLVLERAAPTSSLRGLTPACSGLAALAADARR
jgi:hypothetical protein